MSEMWRKIAGSLLMILTVFLLSAGLLSGGEPETKEYAGRGLHEICVSEIPHLAPDDLSNTGNAEELSVLPGIGPSTAEAILQEREGNGPFQYPEDLISVKGIGEKKMEQIRPMLTVISGESEE